MIATIMRCQQPNVIAASAAIQYLAGTVESRVQPDSNQVIFLESAATAYSHLFGETPDMVPQDVSRLRIEQLSFMGKPVTQRDEIRSVFDHEFPNYAGGGVRRSRFSLATPAAISPTMGMMA